MDTSKDKPFSMAIHGIESVLESNPSGRGGTIRHDTATPGRGGSGCHGDYLLKEWRELEAALAAERDRADRYRRLLGTLQTTYDVPRLASSAREMSTPPDGLDYGEVDLAVEENEAAWPAETSEATA